MIDRYQNAALIYGDQDLRPTNIASSRAWNESPVETPAANRTAISTQTSMAPVDQPWQLDLSSNLMPASSALLYQLNGNTLQSSCPKSKS